MAFYFIRANNYCRKSVSNHLVTDAFCDIISRTVRFMQAQKKFTVAVAFALHFIQRLISTLIVHLNFLQVFLSCSFIA